MGLNRFVCVITMMALAAVAVHAMDVTPQGLEQRAAAIRPTEWELRWQQIPWVISLALAQKEAQSEHRLMFVWTADEDPFDRCWNAAFAFRVGALSDSSVIDTICKNFVLVATNLRLNAAEPFNLADIATEIRLQNTWGILAFRPVGLHVVRPNGTVVASSPVVDSEGVIRFLKGSLAKERQMSPLPCHANRFCPG